MAISETVVVTIRINGAGQIASEVETAGTRGQRAFGDLEVAVASAKKALISMTAVLVAWTAFVAIPERLAQAFASLAISSIRSAAEFERSVLTVAGLLASFQEFGPTVSESFRLAAVQSEKIVIAFEQLAARSLASSKDLTLGFQAFVSRGGLDFVKNKTQDALELTRLLVDTVIALTGGYNKERQIVSEINGFLEGQPRAGNIMSKIIQGQVGDLKKFVEEQRRSGTLLPTLTKMFSGFSEASKALANTFTGLVNSISGSLTTLNAFVQRAGAFKEIKDFLMQWRDLLIGSVKELASLEQNSKGVSKETGLILRDVASVSAATTALTTGFQNVLTNATGTQNQLEQASIIMLKMVASAVVLQTAMERIAFAAFFFKNAFVEVPKSFADFFSGAPLTVERLRSTFLELQDNVFSKLTAGGTLDENMKKAFNDIEANVKRVIEQFKALKAEQANLGKSRPQPLDPQILQKAAKDLDKVIEQEIRARVEGSRILTILADTQIAVIDATKDENLQKVPKILQEVVKRLNEIQNIKIQKVISDIVGAAGRELAGENLFTEFNRNLPSFSRGLKASTTLAVESADALIDRLQELQHELSLVSSGQVPVALDFRKFALASDEAKVEVAKLVVQIIKLEQEFSRIKDPAIQEAIDQIRNRIKTIIKLEDEFKESKLALILFKQLQNLGNTLDEFLFKLKTFKDVTNAIIFELIKGAGEAFAAFFQNLVSGTDNILSALKKLAAGIIDVVADIVFTLGKGILAKGIFDLVFGFPGAGKEIAQGFAILAIAGTLKGLASRLRSTSKEPQPGSEQPGTQRQTIFFQPVGQSQQGLTSVLNQLSSTLDRLESLPPGQVVTTAMSDSNVQRVVTTTVNQTMQRNSRLALDFSNVVLEPS